MLRTVWESDSFTASDVIARTGLTRSTVLGLCGDLLDRGWIRELPDTRAIGQYSKGRPARRYCLDRTAGHVIGVDAGQHRITASIADLRGGILAGAEGTDDDGSLTPAQRRELVLRTVHAAQAELDQPPTPILAVVAGVPAPVDAHGVSPAGEGRYWARMNPGLIDALSPLAQYVEVVNDANLSAVAEGAAGAGQGLDCFASLLSGERFGAGLVVDGVLLRGSYGGAGELRMLDLVQGVGSAHGLAQSARDLVRTAIDAGDVGPDSPLYRNRGTAIGPDSVAVFAAARAGDRVAVGIVEQLADRLARLTAVLATTLDLERVVVSGAIAAALEPVVLGAQRRLPDYTHPPLPTIVASSLGADVVLTGALHRALAEVRQRPLEFALTAAPA